MLDKIMELVVKYWALIIGFLKGLSKKIDKAQEDINEAVDKTQEVVDKIDEALGVDEKE